MMFISPTPPMPSVSVPMNPSRIFRPMVMIWNWCSCFIMLKTKTARLSSGLKLYCCGQHLAHLPFDLFELIAFVAQPDAVQVVRILQVAHGGERNIDDAVDAVVAFLHARRQHADHFES